MDLGKRKGKGGVMRYATSAQIEREGGMVWAVDITGHCMRLTMEEALYWPLVERIVPWVKEGDMWIAPTLQVDGTDQPTLATKD